MFGSAYIFHLQFVMQDYVRAGAISPVSTDIILSGGYDNIVRMYDTRINASVFNMDHGAPVESVLFLPTGGVFLSAGTLCKPSDHFIWYWGLHTTNAFITYTGIRIVRNIEVSLTLRKIVAIYGIQDFCATEAVRLKVHLEIHS